MTTDDLARRGIEALKAGDKERARRLLTEAIQEDPQHQVALLWMATVADDAAEKKHYLERVVAVNPNNDAGQRAATGLAQMADEASSAATQFIGSSPATSQPDQPPSPFSASDATIVTPPASSSSQPPAETIVTPSESPFQIPSEPQPSAFESSVPSPQGSASQDPGSPPPFSPPAGSYTSASPPEKEKKNNTPMIIGIISAVILIPCICGVVVIGALTILGSQVEEVFSEIEQDLGTGGDLDPLTLDAEFQGSFEIGEQVSSELDSILDAHEWTFEGEAGQSVTIRGEAARGSSTDPRLHLLDPDGTTIAIDDDGGSGFNSLIIIELPDDGTYTIQVDVFEPGEYILSVN